MNTRPTHNMVKETIALAETWQQRDNELMSLQEKSRNKQLTHLLADPKDKTLLTKLSDQSFRSCDPRRIADQICHTYHRYGNLGDRSLERE